MDIISHGLWGGLVLGTKSKKTYLSAFVISMLPDLFSFGVLFADRLLGISASSAWGGDHRSLNGVPLYVHHLYNVTHSFIIFGLVFGLVWLVRKKPFVPLLAWGLHILVDIPSHSFAFFPTPIFWPLSDYKYNGINWGDPRIYYPNLIFLSIGYGIYFWQRRKKTQSLK